jgi:hypothetical protein
VGVKYCVLCRGEYRESVSTCATCRAPLVDSFSSQEALNNPARLLWIGKDAEEFEIVAIAVRDAEIPACVLEKTAGLFASLVRSQSQIHVLSRDFSRALTTSANAIQAQERFYRRAQTCHSCARQCSAYLAACPYCNSELIVEQTRERNGAETPGSPASAMKYCPVCDAEYSGKHASCTICGVSLVPEELRGQPLDEQQRNERIELVWRGGDPGAVSEVIQVLREAGIRHHVQATNEHLVFELGMPRPKYAVRTFASDSTRAKELLADIYETSPFVSMEASALVMAEEPLEPRSRRQTWAAAAATAEIWAGEDEGFAELLQACLRENGIGVRRQGKPPGTMVLRVMPADEAAAREIIREVREASPPV